MRRLLLAAAVVAAVVVGGWVWWQQGGFGGPVSDEAARRYFDRIVAAAQAKDFQALCDLNGSARVCREDRIVAAAQAKDFEALCALNGSAGTCRKELQYYCPENFGSGPAPRFPEGDELEQECREPVPPDPPGVISSRHHPSSNGYTGGRILLAGGVESRGKPYETEVLIFRDKRSYKAIHAVFWSGDKFDEVYSPDGGVKGGPSPQ